MRRLTPEDRNQDRRGPGASPVAREVKYMRGPGADIPIENMHQRCLDQIKCASPERAVPWAPLKNAFVRENTCVANARRIEMRRPFATGDTSVARLASS